MGRRGEPPNSGPGMLGDPGNFRNVEPEADGACLGASCHDVGKPMVTFLGTVPMAVRIHVHSRFKDTTLTFGGGKKHSLWGSEEGWRAHTESPGSGTKQGPCSRRDVRPAGRSQGYSGEQGQAPVGKQRGGDPAKPPAEGRHTIKDSVFPINFSPSDTALGKEQSYTTIFSCVCSLSPSSLGWALSRSREERQSSRCWHNLCSPWRAEAARGDQTGHRGQVGTEAMLHRVFKTRQEGVFWCRNQKPAHSFRR